jgi:hypothetical protein
MCRSNALQAPPRGLALALLALTAWLGLRQGVELRGDGREYILQTQAIVLHGALRIEPNAARAYWNRTNPFGGELGATHPPARALAEDSQAGGGFGGLYPDRAGAYRYYHFWGYSLAVAPLYALLHALWPSREYWAFPLMNLLFFALPFGLAWRRRPSWFLICVGVLTLLTPLPRYLSWPHPELFCFGLALTGLLLATHPRRGWLGATLLAVAAAQNIPIALFFPLHGCLLWRTRAAAGAPTLRSVATLGGVYLPALLVLCLSLAYFRHHFGASNLIAQLGLARLDYASWPRVAALLASPLVGALWFYPLCFLLVPATIQRRTLPWLLLAGVSVVCAAWLATATANFSSDQIRALRYSAWLLVPLWWVLLHNLATPPHPNRFAWGAVASLVTAVFMYGPRLCAALPAPAATLYHLTHFADDPEVLAEHIMGREVPQPAAFHGLYIWNLPGGESLWLVSRRWAGMNPALLKTLAPPPAWRAHPLLGDHLLLWRQVQPQSVEGDNPAFIRNPQGRLIYPVSRAK